MPPPGAPSGSPTPMVGRREHPCGNPAGRCVVSPTKKSRKGIEPALGPGFRAGAVRSGAQSQKPRENPRLIPHPARLVRDRYRTFLSPYFHYGRCDRLGKVIIFPGRIIPRIHTWVKIEFDGRYSHKRFTQYIILHMCLLLVLSLVVLASFRPRPTTRVEFS